VSVLVQGEPVVLTDANGDYAFNGLVPGSYSVAELVSAGSVQTYDLNPSGLALMDLNSAGSSNASGFIEFNGLLYFSADGNDGAGRELWSYDGETATRVADINPGSGDAIPSRFAVYNDALYFRAFTPSNGTELWRYDGSSVTRISDINSGAGSSTLGELLVFKDELVFSARGASGQELYSYDGNCGVTMALPPRWWQKSIRARDPPRRWN
jgi:ELWxxDGT repeat protein